MENLALAGLVENLKPAMTEVFVRRIVQHQPDGFIFQTRSPRLPAFKILMHARQPALYASEARPPFEAPATDFLMVLRKHLTSAELISFSKPLAERVVEFEFKTVVPSKELETMWLVVELLPNAPNLILLDAERRVVSSLLPLTPQHGIDEYEPYRFPGSTSKIDIARIVEEDVPELAEYATAANPQTWLIQHVGGFGPVFAAELVHRQKRSGHGVVEEIRSMVAQVRASSRGAWLYTELPLGHILESNDLRRLGKAILSPIPLESLERTHSSRMFGSIVEGARFYFDELESHTLLEESKQPVLRDLREAAKRTAHREQKLIKQQRDYEAAAGLQKTAQLLNSSGLKMDQHYASVAVNDYFGETPREVEVTLDSTFSLRENIDRMFKRHSKAERGKQMIGRRLAQVRNQHGRLDEQLRRVQAIRDWDTWLAVATRLHKDGRAKAEADVADVIEKEPVLRRFRTALIEGREVYVGRNARENDEVTFEIAAPDDFWLHVAEYTGSHVVVRNTKRDKELEPSVLVKAAQIAAFFSQARNTSKVEVHYTRRKHIVKPKRARAGMVRLLEFRSISVEPRNWLES
jgi:predicted ribosome quality control (RQC) complex YloA/Tae2 family protein